MPDRGRDDQWPIALVTVRPSASTTPPRGLLKNKLDEQAALLMPRSRCWPVVDVDRRVREAGGWLGPTGAPTEQEPDMAGAFTALRRMNDVAFETARAEERAVQERAA
jgi:hypothetical protein